MRIFLMCLSGDEPTWAILCDLQPLVSGGGVKIAKIAITPVRDARLNRKFGCIFQYVSARGSCLPCMVETTPTVSAIVSTFSSVFRPRSRSTHLRDSRRPDLAEPLAVFCAPLVMFVWLGLDPLLDGSRRFVSVGVHKHTPGARRSHGIDAFCMILARESLCKSTFQPKPSSTFLRFILSLWDYSSSFLGGICV